MSGGMEDAAACENMANEVWTAAYDIAKLLKEDKPDPVALVNAGMKLRGAIVRTDGGHRGLTIDPIATISSALPSLYRVRKVSWREYVLEKKTQSEEWA